MFTPKRNLRLGFYIGRRNLPPRSFRALLTHTHLDRMFRVRAMLSRSVDWAMSARNHQLAQHKLLTRAKAINAPAMISPRIPARRSLFRITPTRLRINPNGVASSIVSPPRAEIGEPQPGFASHIVASAATEASEKNRPIRPKPTFRPGAGSAWMIGGSAIFRGLELHSDRLAGRGQRLEVELNVDVHFLTGQVLGYSP